MTDLYDEVQKKITECETEIARLDELRANLESTADRICDAGEYGDKLDMDHIRQLLEEEI